MKDKLAKTVFILCVLVGLLFIFIIPLSKVFGINTEVLMEKRIFLLMFPAVYMSMISILMLIFRNEAGMWAANYRKKMADKYPVWKKMAGLPEEKLQYYFSVEFNRKIIVVSAIIMIIISFLLMAVIIVING